MAGILELIEAEHRDIQAISAYFNELTAQAVAEVNEAFMPTRLFKSTVKLEPLPLDARHLADYRTRIGLMLEYAASSSMHRLLQDDTDGQLFLTFVWYNTYPDFIVRDIRARPLLRFEMKAVDALSDEQAAKFGTLIDDIWDEQDMLVLFAWHIDELVDEDGTPVGQVPHVFNSLVVPAIDLAAERDLRLTLTGGQITGREVFVVNKKGVLAPDPMNFGKFKRLIHKSRREDPELTDACRLYLAFIEDVIAKATQLNGSGHKRSTA